MAVSAEDAHEINNLLVYVILGLELIEREASGGCDREKIRELVEDALDGAEKVRDLLKLKRSMPAAGPRAQTARPRLLLVDDDARLGQTLAIGLKHRADLVQVRTGAEALRVLAAGAFDLVLCDLNLPDLSGMEVYAQAPQQDRFVFTTGGALTEKASEFLQNARRLDKPFRLEELEALLATGRPAPG